MVVQKAFLFVSRKNNIGKSLPISFLSFKAFSFQQSPETVPVLIDFLSLLFLNSFVKGFSLLAPQRIKPLFRVSAAPPFFSKADRSQAAREKCSRHYFPFSSESCLLIEIPKR